MRNECDQEILDKKHAAIMKCFGKNVKKIRLKNKINQREFAKRACLHYTYLSSIERGRRNVSLINIYNIAKALSCNLSELLPIE